MLEENIERVLEEIKPYLQTDGGDVELVSVEDGWKYLSPDFWAKAE